MMFFYVLGQQWDGEGVEQGNEGGDFGDNCCQFGIFDVIMEEVYQGFGLKEKGILYQKDIVGEDLLWMIGVQINSGVFQGYVFFGKGDFFFDVVKVYQQEKGCQYVKNYCGIEEFLLLVVFVQYVDQWQCSYGDDGGVKGVQ